MELEVPPNEKAELLPSDLGTKAPNPLDLLASPNAEKPLGLLEDDAANGEEVLLAVPNGLDDPKAGFVSAGVPEVDMLKGDAVPEEGFAVCPKAVLDPKAGAELPPNPPVAGGVDAADAKGELLEEVAAVPKAEPLLLKPEKAPPGLLLDGVANCPKDCV